MSIKAHYSVANLRKKTVRRFSAIVFLATFWSIMSYAHRWKGDQMFCLLVKVSFAYLLPASLKSLCFSVLSTKRQFRSVL